MKANRGKGSNRTNPTPQSESIDNMLRKYAEMIRAHQRLLGAYTDLVDRYRFIIHDRGGTSAAAEWFMGSANGLALLRGGAVTMTNRSLRMMDEMASPDGWRELPSGAGEPAQYASLRDLLRSMYVKAIDGQKTMIEMRCGAVAGTMIIDAGVQRSMSATTYIGIAANVTARVRMEDELAAARQAQFQSERMRSLGSLSSGLAHDINNSLNALKLHLSVLEMDPGRLTQKFPVLHRIVDDCASLVRRLQDFARQRRDPPVGHCQIERVIAEAVQMVHSELVEKTALTDKPVTIVVETPLLPMVPGDPVELRHVFVNLLLNARDAMPDGGKIEIIGHAAEGRVIISIADEGSGIPPDAIDRLFDPFFTTKGMHGTGLGLATAYGVMTRLGGAIRAENRPDRGAMFTATFPAAPDWHEEKPLPIQLNNAGAPLRILAVDDHPENIEPLKNLFEIKGHRVDLAFGGADAIERFGRGDIYDVVLCDVGMPGINGWQVAERLRGIAPGTAIYLLTGWAQEIPLDEPRRVLIDGLIPKPINPDQLEQIISRVH
jgi:signal transduction histidine kinase